MLSKLLPVYYVMQRMHRSPDAYIQTLAERLRVLGVIVIIVACRIVIQLCGNPCHKHMCSSLLQWWGLEFTLLCNAYTRTKNTLQLRFAASFAQDRT